MVRFHLFLLLMRGEEEFSAAPQKMKQTAIYIPFNRQMLYLMHIMQMVDISNAQYNKPLPPPRSIIKVFGAFALFIYRLKAWVKIREYFHLALCTLFYKQTYLFVGEE